MSPKEIAEKILNCKTYDIPDIQILASAYLEFEKQYLLCAMERNHYEEELTKLKEENENLKMQNQQLIKLNL